MYNSIEEILIDDVLIATEKVDKFVNEYANLKAIVTDKTSNSVEVKIFTKNLNGVNALQWFRYADFIKYFRVV